MNVKFKAMLKLLKNLQRKTILKKNRKIEKIKIPIQI